MIGHDGASGSARVAAMIIQWPCGLANFARSQILLTLLTHQDKQNIRDATLDEAIASANSPGLV